MKVLLKITQEKFKNEVLTNKNLKTHGDIVLKNPYRQGASPCTKRLGRLESHSLFSSSCAIASATITQGHRHREHDPG
jgi:hypothetical protein